MGKKNKQKKEKKEESKQDKKDNRKEPKNVKPKKVEDIPEEPEEIEKVEKELDQNELNNKYCTYLEIVKKELMPQLSDSQIEKALKALVLYKNKSNSTGGINVLSGDFDDYIYINFGFTKYPMRYSLSSSQISIKNGIYNQKFSSNICLIVKNPKSDFKDLEIEFPFNLKVIDIEKLKLKYQKYEKRRELLKKYDLFLCDNRIKFVLKKLLVVNDSTIFHMNNGPIYNIKFGRFSMTDKENIQNFKQCVEQVVPHILKYDIPLDELRNISIKGNNTIELPIFNHINEDYLKIYTGNI